MKHLDACMPWSAQIYAYAGQHGARNPHAPIVCYHQYTRAIFVLQPVAGVYHHSALPVRVAGTSALDHTILFPPTRLELDRDFDRRAVIEGADGLALLIGHRDLFGVDSAEVSKRDGRNNVAEVLFSLTGDIDLHEREAHTSRPTAPRRKIWETLLWW